MAINKYPYTNFNEYNLDWIIKKIREFETELTDYEALHSITFGGDWDISKSYTQWTIVSDPATHNGYLSLQPVPYNVPITDTAYWLKIADYTTGLAAVNARVDSVEADITDNIKPDITAIETDITDNIKPDIDAIEADITDNVKPAITANAGDITDLQAADVTINARIDSLKKRNIVFIGDSWQQGYNPEGDTTPFYEYVEDFINAIRPDITVTIYHEEYGGIGFAHINNARNFLTLLENSIIDVTDPDEITDIVVSGGYNDAYESYNDIKGAISTFTARARTLYPNAAVWINPCGYCRGAAVRGNIEAHVIPAYTAAANAFVMSSTVRLFHWFGLLDRTDYYHPTEDGQKVLGYCIASELLNVKPIYTEANNGAWWALTFTPNTSYTFSGGSTFTESMKVDTVGLWANFTGFSASAGVMNADGTDNQALGELVDPQFLGAQIHSNDYFYETMAVGQDSNGVFAPIDLKFYIEESGSGKLYLKFHAFAIRPDGSNYLADLVSVFKVNFTNIQADKTLY